MDIDKLDKKIKQILSQEDGARTYSEIREELIANGFSQEEMVDDKLLTSIDKGDLRKVAIRNMIIGSILAIVSLTVIGGSYFGQQAPKEVYYVSLVIFAVGYLVFRDGFRRFRGGNNENRGILEQ